MHIGMVSVFRSYLESVNNITEETKNTLINECFKRELYVQEIETIVHDFLKITIEHLKDSNHKNTDKIEAHLEIIGEFASDPVAFKERIREHTKENPPQRDKKGNTNQIDRQILDQRRKELEEKGKLGISEESINREEIDKQYEQIQQSKKAGMKFIEKLIEGRDFEPPVTKEQFLDFISRL